MRLEEVLPALREGKRIRKKGFSPISIHMGFVLTETEIVADDWELVKDPIVRRMRCTAEEIREKFGHLDNNIEMPTDIPDETRFKITVEEIIKEAP
jgi:hypothetical protein